VNDISYARAAGWLVLRILGFRYASPRLYACAHSAS